MLSIFDRLTVPEEILPATPSTSSDEEGSLSSLEVGMEEEMEPIKEEPEAEAKEELEDSRHDHGAFLCLDFFPRYVSDMS